MLALSFSPLPPVPDPRPSPSQAQGNYLFIISHGEQTEREVRFYSYTATPESFQVVKELIDDLEEYWRSGGDAEEPRILFDIFTYLCGKWPEGARPPFALPCHLWFTPREAFGTWEELLDDEFFLLTGSWTRVVHTTFYGEAVGNEEDRAVSKGEWDNQVQLNKNEEELRQAREAEKQK